MAATVAFWCTQCGYRQDVPERLVDRKVKCPKCETRQILRSKGPNQVLKKGEKGDTSVVTRRSTGTAAHTAGGQPTLPGTRTIKTTSSLNHSFTTPPTVVEPADKDVNSFDELDFEATEDELSAGATPAAAQEDSLESVFGPSSVSGIMPKKPVGPSTQTVHTTQISQLSLLGGTLGGGNSLGTIRPTTDTYAKKVTIAAGYQLGTILGRGGMGAVHASRQLALERTVAIKTMLAKGDGAAASRFRAEAMVMALLEHPNIMPVHDLISAENGELQLVMKKVEGVTWRELNYPSTPAQIRRAMAMKLDDHVEILLKVCDAVAFAHAKGIIHLDLKPANIMVGAFGEVLVLDWGCAMAFTDIGNDAVPKVMNFRGLSGTPAYMAPEMAGQTGNLGPHTDIYLLGAILFELVAGHPPHKADSLQSSIAHAAANDITPPQLERGGKKIPSELVELAMRTMSRDIAQRPSTVADLAQQLRDFRRHEEAITGVDTARTRLAAATSQPDKADDLYRQALAACEQAVAQWPEYGVGRDLLGQILLGYAQYLHGTGAFRLAQGKAEAAIEFGGRHDDATLVKAARDVHATAVSDERFQQARTRNMRVLLAGLVVLMAVGIIGLGYGMSQASTQDTRIHSESQRYDDLLESLDKERKERLGEQGLYAPVLLETATRAVEQRNFKKGLDALDAAARLAPKLDQALLLKAEILAGQQQYATALPVLDQYLARHGDDNLAKHLHDLVTSLKAAPTPQLESELGDLFISQNLFTLAEGRKLTPETQLRFYTRALEKVWPGAAANLRMTDGRLDFVREPGKDGPSNAQGVNDLTPLRGLPFRELWLQDTRITSIAALKDMPLKVLILARAPVRDLGPLAGGELEVLDISESNVVDLRPLQGLQLRSLAASGTGAIDLLPLSDMPLRDLDLARTKVVEISALARCTRLQRLNLAGTHVSNLSMLSTLPLQSLSLRDTAVSDLSDLRGVPLTAIDLANTAVRTLGPLARAPLEELDVEGCRALATLDGLAGLPLRRLNIVGTRVTDLGALAGAPLERIDLNPAQITANLDVLRKMPTLQQIGPEPLRTPAEFWRKHDAEH